MKLHMGVFSAAVLASAIAFAQHAGGGSPGGHSFGGGHIPAHGPNPTGGPGRLKPSVGDEVGHPSVPHVHADDDRWVGHDTGRNDPHYHLDSPWEHGHFPGAIGAGHV
jgi:hypothetical protein